MKFTGERYVPSLRGQISYEHLHRYAIAARFCNGKRVLDIASGEGYGAALLARTASDVIGVDIDEQSVDHARAAYYASNLRFLRGPVTEIPLADDSVDVVVSFETIEHVDQHERMLDEFRRVLAPGGVVVISSPNKLVYSDIADYTNPFHVKELYFAELRDLLKRRFGHVVFYGQRLAASSIIHPLAGAVSEDAAWYSGGVQHLATGLPTLNNPVYFVAVCSDEARPTDVSSAYVDPGDDILEDLWVELDALRAHHRRALGERSQPALTDPRGDTPLAFAPGREDEVRAAERRVVELEAEIERLRESADAASAAVRAEYEVELAARRGERADHDADLARLRAEYDAELARLRAEHEAETARVRAVFDGETIQARSNHEAERASLQATIGEQAEVAARLERALDDMQAEMERTRAAVVVASAEAGEERARVAELMHQVAEARAAAAAAEREIDAHVMRETAALREQVRGLSEALERAEVDSRTLREVLASHSWKITMPLRRAIRFVRR